MATLMQSLERATDAVQDPILRNHATRLLQGMDAIDTEVLSVGQTRSVLPKVRHRLNEGGAARFAARGDVRDAQATTVMLSQETLNRLVISIIQRSAQIQFNRSLPGEVLVGLQPVPAAADFEIDFDTIAKGESDRTIASIEL